MPNQTRYFYEEWCDFFQLDIEGEDPRVYENGKVVGVKDHVPPQWGERVPWLPGIWRRNLVAGKEENKDLKLKIKIIDVCWYHKKDDNLMKLIKDFQPTTLIIDWCNTRQGHTMEKITAAGIASRLRMETEMFLMSKNKHIFLSDEQKVVLGDVEKLKLQPQKGSVVFL